MSCVLKTCFPESNSFTEKAQLIMWTMDSGIHDHIVLSLVLHSEPAGIITDQIAGYNHSIKQ